MGERYLRPSRRMREIYLYRPPLDFRKQAQGLALLVEQQLGRSPFDGALYAFTNRRRDRIKCLFWEDNGFVLYYIRPILVPVLRTRACARSAARSARRPGGKR